MDRASPSRKSEVNHRKSNANPRKSQATPRKSQATPRRSQDSPRKSQESPSKAQGTSRKSNIPQRKNQIPKHGKTVLTQTPKTTQEEYEELLKLGTCLECQWDRNYHPCQLSNVTEEENERCKEDMKNRGIEYEEPKQLCSAEHSQHLQGYQSGHFYALNSTSHIDDEDEGALDENEALHSRKSRKSFGVANYAESTAKDKAVREHAHFHALHHDRGSIFDFDDPLIPSKTKSFHSTTAIRKSTNKSKVHRKSKAHPVEEDTSPLEYKHLLHPKAKTHTEEVLRDDIVPLPSHIQPPTKVRTKSQAYLNGRDDDINPSDQNFTRDENKSKVRYAESGQSEFSCENGGTLCDKPQCSWNKNYHPCNNTIDKKDAELCRVWIKERGIVAEERMTEGRLVGLNPTHGTVSVASTAATHPSEIVVNDALSGVLRLILCAEAKPFAEMEEEQVTKLVKELISKAEQSLNDQKND